MDVVCRFGGDEFILLLPSADGREAASVADRIRRDYAAASAQLLCEPASKTMSIGISSRRATNPTPTNSELLMVAADRALYRAKHAGRNRICAA